MADKLVVVWSGADPNIGSGACLTLEEIEQRFWQRMRPAQVSFDTESPDDGPSKAPSDSIGKEGSSAAPARTETDATTASDDTTKTTRAELLAEYRRLSLPLPQPPWSVEKLRSHLIAEKRELAMQVVRPLLRFIDCDPAAAFSDGPRRRPRRRT